MVQITALLVKTLREKTDAPMMECKKALVEANGNLSHAEDLIRISFGKKANKISTRLSSEGLIGLYISKSLKKGALVEVNSETDFVARNENFQCFVKKLAELIVENSLSSISDLLNFSWNNQTIRVWLESLIGKIGENISIRRFSHFESNFTLAGYLHNGKIGVLVDFDGPKNIGKDLAMHIAALKPIAMNKSDINPIDISRERSLAEKKVAQSGKTGAIAEKIIEGSLQKFFNEVTLMSQFFIKEPKQTIAEMLRTNDASVKKFMLYLVGDTFQKEDVHNK